MAATNIAQISDDSFDSEVLKSPLPVLIDFWAPWCGPCRAIAPMVDELAGEYAGKLKIGKMNVDDNPRTPARYGVRGIPLCSSSKTDTSSSRSSVQRLSPTWSKRLPPLCHQNRNRLVLKKSVRSKDCAADC